jgi:hypothetical protein
MHDTPPGRNDRLSQGGLIGKSGFYTLQ